MKYFIGISLLSVTLCALAQIPTAEREALISFYEATAGDQWHDNSGWKTENGAFSQPGTEGDWYGVEISSDRAHVTTISMISNNLNGTIPENFSDLTHLRYLYLSGNHFETFPLPITKLVNLEALWLGNCNLQGPIPLEMSQLTNLRIVSMSRNAFSGPIDTQFSGLDRLTELSLNDNQITSWLGLKELTQLRFLSLRNNRLSGSFPKWIAELPNLRDLSLSDNRYNGTFPQEVARITTPITIRLNNNLIRHFPFSQWNSNLELFLQDNRLDETSCAALEDAADRGAKIVFSNQGAGPLNCGVMQLRQTLPWVSQVRGEWDNEIHIYNPSAEKAFVQLYYPKQTSFYPTPISPGTFRRFFVRDSDSGFHLHVFSDNNQILTSYRVASENAPSGFSPALTLGQRPEQGHSHLLFPVLPASLKAAFAINAPQGLGASTLRANLYGGDGLLGTTELSLEGDLSQAALIPDLFPEIQLTSDLALEVISLDDLRLFGTAFAFNDLNEPAMMPAISWNKASSEWLLPWAAANDQFTSQIAVFNPGQDSAEVTFTATDRWGTVSQEVRQIEGNTPRSFDTGELFPGLRGYAIAVRAQNDQEQPQPVFANLQVGNREDRLSGSSPALTRALDPSTLSPVVALPIPDLEDIPAIVLQAPNHSGPLEVVLLELGTTFQNPIKTLKLEGGRPHPILVRDLETRSSRGSILITAVAPSGQPLAGSVFSFNEFREPSMTQGQNQIWFDLNVALSYQPDTAMPVVVTVENEGPFASPAEVTCQVLADGQIIATEVLAAQQVGEQATFKLSAEQLPANGFQRELTAKLFIPPQFTDRDASNNRIDVGPERSLLLKPSYRMNTSRGAGLTGVIHADETMLAMPITQLVLNPGDVLDFSMERFQIETRDSFDIPTYHIQGEWQPEQQALCVWDENTGSLNFSRLEPKAVYRIHGEIRASTGEIYSFPNIAMLSKSAYEKTTMDYFGRTDPAARMPRVYHPFDNRNWAPATLFSTEPPTLFFNENAGSAASLHTIASAIIFESQYDAADHFILELPEGIYDLDRRTLKFGLSSRREEKPFAFTLEGAGKQRTLLTDLDLAPVATRQPHPPLTNRLQISSYDSLDIRGLALWGAIPGDDVAMEVGGRPALQVGGRSERPYAWFSRGLGISRTNRISIADVDLRFHAVGMLLENNGNPEAGDLQTHLRDITIGYSDSGMLLRDMSHIQVGPAVAIHHMSSQGIFANRVDDIVIEDTIINGARHRGINLDQASRAWVRNNQVLNSGQSGIHLGGDVHFAAVTGNTIRTVDRDRPNPFGDENSVDGTILSYRPLYEGIKSVRGQWGDSDHLLIADNDIADVANGIAIVQGNASDIVIENNSLQVWQRGIRLEYGHARLLVDNGFAFEGFLSNLFVMPNNQINLTETISADNDVRHGILFPDADPACLGCNIDFLDSYGDDFRKQIAFYPFPIEFASYEPCVDAPETNCRVWLSNADARNPGPVYLPSLTERDYYHPLTEALVFDQTVMDLGTQLRNTILSALQ